MPLPPTTEKTMCTEIDNLLEDKERELLQAIKAENLDRTEFLTKVETVGMMGVLYRLQMNLHDKIENFEDISCLNPTNKKSMDICTQKLISEDFFQNVYPDELIAKHEAAIHETDRGLHAPPPPTLFLPSKKIMRTMIQTNLRYSSKENEHLFLLRFGLLDDPIWYSNYSTIKLAL